MMNQIFKVFCSAWIFLVMLCSSDNATVGSTGKEFVFVLMQERLPGDAMLQISSDVTTHVTIEAPFIGLSKSITVNAGVSKVTLDSALRGANQKISFKGIRIKADEPISVIVLDAMPPNSGGYLALPVESLANEYMVMAYKSRDQSEFAISPVSDRTSVSINLKTTSYVTYLGQTYHTGDVIKEILDTFQTWQIRSDGDLTGTIVKADGKVAVVSGSACAHVPTNAASCDYVVEQLPTVVTWATQFVVPLVGTCVNVIRALSRDDDTTVTFTFNGQTTSQTLNSTEYVDQTFSITSSTEGAVVVESTRPVLLALFIGPTSLGPVSEACGPSMTLVPAVTQYANKYKFGIPENLNQAVLSIIAPTVNASGLRINGNEVTSTAQHHVMLQGSKQNFTVVEVNGHTFSGEVEITHSKGAYFGAIFHGGKGNETFGFPLGMRLDLSKANEVIRLRDGNTGAMGRVEVYHRGNWGTVCDAGFDVNDASVVCRSLGFYFGATSSTIGHYGPGNGHVLVENLQCDGTEFDLHQCRSDPWETSNCPHSRDVGVDCRTKVRLVGTNNATEGRVEVFYNGEWGTVCDDNFGTMETLVVCSSLGFGRGGNFYTGGGSSGPQWMDDLQCTGEESDIGQCMSKNWGVTDCTHQEDVWVACRPSTTIRLVNGSSQAEGRLEVLLQDTWHTVCDNMFDEQDAIVVCNMLGYKRIGVNVNVRVYSGAHFGQGSGQVAIDELSCTGNELDIVHCQSRPWLVNTCTHLHDVGVSCGSQIRLVNGTRPSVGRLEMFYKDHWGSVCNAWFDVSDAMVVCTHMGYPYWSGYTPIKDASVYGSGNGRIVVDKLGCVGTETDIAQCPSNTWLDTPGCDHGNDVGIDCGTAIRLVNGSSPSNGRVEVYYDGQWGTVCSDNFDVNAATVLCRQLGYHAGYVRAITNGYYGPGTGRIVIDDLSCSGSETDVQFCASSPWLTHDCTHAQDVGIACADTGLRLSDAVSATCSQGDWNIRLDMRILQIMFPEAVYSDIVLGNSSQCKGTLSGHDLTFGQSLDACDTVKRVTVTSNKYTGTLVYAYHNPVQPDIVRSRNWTASLSCEILTNGTSITDVNASNNSTGNASNTQGTYTVQHGFYRDPGFTQRIADLHLANNSDVYMKISALNAEPSTKMVVQRCYATSTPSRTDVNKLFFIKDRCPIDNSVSILRTTAHEFGFKFSVVQLNHQNQKLYIHCEETFCVDADTSPDCIQTCSH